ncbi:MAG: glycoside hydrolase family 5 [Verrucomicrobiales bacterium]|nr:glycoside hydrolase family 5 [Verrucomicrobiales bacterium]
MQIKKFVLMAAVAGLSLTLLFGQNPDVDSQRGALDVLREKRMQLDNPQTVTQSKIFILQQKDFEAKAEAARARAEEARNRAKAAKAKSAEPPTATEKLNRPAYEQKRLELTAEQSEAEAEVAQAEVEAAQSEVDALKSKVAASKAKADEVRTSPYRRAQSKYYDAQWQEQLEKKTLEEQVKVSKESALKAKVAAEAARRAKLARDNARKSALAMSKKSGTPVVAPSANDEEMARRAHELELVQARAEKDAAAARERAKKAQVSETVKTSPPVKKSVEASVEASKYQEEENRRALAQKEAREADLKVEAARKQQLEIERRAEMLNAEERKAKENARKYQEEENRLALVQKARSAEIQAEAARKEKLEIARQAKELEAEERKAKAKKQDKAPVAALRSAPVQPSEVESDVQAKAMEALRRKQADLDAQDAQAKGVTPTAKTATAKTTAPAVTTTPKTVPSSDVSTESNATEKALEALRQKQAALDAEESQARVTAMSAKERAKAEAKAQKERDAQEKANAKLTKAQKPAPVQTEEPPVKKQVVSRPITEPKTKADELDLAARNKKSQQPPVERVTTPRVVVNAGEIEAETKKLQELRQRQADLRAQQIKIKADLQNAVRNGSDNKGKTDESGVELIVDNPASRQNGTWMTGKTRGFYGADYVWKGKGTGSSYVKFVPVIPMAGDYEVYEWHVGGTNRASDTPYIISYSGGTQTILVNQQNNGAKWNLLGKFNFAQGSSGEVRITDGISTAGQMVMADALRFVAAGSGSGATVADAGSKEIEDLRKQQTDLDAELATLKESIAATDKHIATMKQGEETAQIEAAEQQAIKNATAAKPQTTKIAAKPEPKKVEPKKTAANKKSPPTTLTAEVTAALTPKEKKLAEILVRYKNDEITPHEYHQMRAKIIAEP